MDPAARSALRQTARLLLDYLSAGFFRATRTFRYALEDRMGDRLPEMGIPTLVVRGSRGPIAPRQWAKKRPASRPRVDSS